MDLWTVIECVLASFGTSVPICSAFEPFLAGFSPTPVTWSRSLTQGGIELPGRLNRDPFVVFWRLYLDPELYHEETKDLVSVLTQDWCGGEFTNSEQSYPATWCGGNV